MASASQPVAGFRAGGPSYIATIAIGHGLKHWYLAAFAVFLPLIEAEYELTTTGVFVLVTIRQLAGGIPNFFVGFVSDKLRDYWHWLLPASLLTAAGSILLAALAPWYWLLIGGFALAGTAAAFWHPAAISMLSTRFPERKGMAIAFHGSGSGAGESLGPLGVGFLLAVVLADDWRLYAMLSMIPAIGFSVLLYWMLVGAGAPAHPDSTSTAKLTDVFTMLRYPVFRTLAFTNFIRSFAHFGVLSFIPIYLARDLGMDSFGVGIHVALLTLLGVGLGPAFGHFSDRIGRRWPIVGAMAVVSMSMFAMGIVEDGILLTIALAVAGLFLWSMQDITNAAAMDAAPPGKQGSVVGMMFTSSFGSGIMAAAVMWLAISLSGDRTIIFFVGGASLVPGIFVLAVAPIERKRD